MCLAQGPQHSDAGEARTLSPSVSSQALYHWATALPYNHKYDVRVTYHQRKQWRWASMSAVAMTTQVPQGHMLLSTRCTDSPWEICTLILVRTWWPCVYTVTTWSPENKNKHIYITLYMYFIIRPLKYHVFENIMENRAFALLEQMLHFHNNFKSIHFSWFFQCCLKNRKCYCYLKIAIGLTIHPVHLW